MSKKLNKNSETICPAAGWGGELNEAQKKAFREGVAKLSKISTAEEVKESEPKVDIPFQEALDALVGVPQTEQEIRTFGGGSAKFQEAMEALVDLPQEPHQRDKNDEEMDRLTEEFEKNYKASVDKVVDCFENEIKTNDCFAWTSETQGATEYDLLADVLIENARRGVRCEQAMRHEMLGKLEEDAKTLLSALNTIDWVKGDIEGRFKSLPPTEAVVVHAFLHSDKQAKIIKEMYGDEFDSISPNIEKYLKFLERVKAEGRIPELYSILKSYGE